MKKTALCLIFSIFLSLIAIGDEYGIVLWHNNGKTYYLQSDSIDSVSFSLSDSLHGKLIGSIDTITLHDTLSIVDTIDVHDTISICDTISIFDTITVRDTLVLLDTLEFHDTITVLDTLTIRDTLLIRDTLMLHDTINVDNIVYQSVTNADKWYINIENEVVADYMNSVDYSNYCDDYTFTDMPVYSYRETEYRKDQPNGVTIDLEGLVSKIVISLSKDFSVGCDTINLSQREKTVSIFNLIPGNTYYYRQYSGETVKKESHFFTHGQVRMIYLPSMRNMRDLGGWPTEDGHKLKYGRIFRGGEMNDYYNISPQNGETHTISSEDSLYMHDKLKIRVEIDLRDNRDMNLSDDDPSNDRNHTELGDDVDYYNEPVNYATEAFTRYSYYFNQRWGRALKKIINGLKNNKNIYFHCVWGADRTGTLAMLIEGLCGVSESDINKDYEITSFYGSKYRTSDYWGPNLQHIKSMQGETLKDKFANYCIKIGLSSSDIEDLRNIMIE